MDGWDNPKASSSFADTKRKEEPIECDPHIIKLKEIIQRYNAWHDKYPTEVLFHLLNTIENRRWNNSSKPLSNDVIKDIWLSSLSVEIRTRLECLPLKDLHALADSANELFLDTEGRSKKNVHVKQLPRSSGSNVGQGSSKTKVQEIAKAKNEPEGMRAFKKLGKAKSNALIYNSTSADPKVFELKQMLNKFNKSGLKLPSNVYKELRAVSMIKWPDTVVLEIWLSSLPIEINERAVLLFQYYKDTIPINWNHFPKEVDKIFKEWRQTEAAQNTKPEQNKINVTTAVAQNNTLAKNAPQNLNTNIFVGRKEVSSNEIHSENIVSSKSDASWSSFSSMTFDQLVIELKDALRDYNREYDKYPTLILQYLRDIIGIRRLLDHIPENVMKLIWLSSLPVQVALRLPRQHKTLTDLSNTANLLFMEWKTVLKNSCAVTKLVAKASISQNLDNALSSTTIFEIVKELTQNLQQHNSKTDLLPSHVFQTLLGYLDTHTKYSSLCVFLVKEIWLSSLPTAVATKIESLPIEYQDDLNCLAVTADRFFEEVKKCSLTVKDSSTSAHNYTSYWSPICKPIETGTKDTVKVHNDKVIAKKRVVKQKGSDWPKPCMFSYQWNLKEAIDSYRNQKRKPQKTKPDAKPKTVKFHKKKERARLDNLLTEFMQTGLKKPSEMLKFLRQETAAAPKFGDDVLKHIWLSHLPDDITAFLSTESNYTLNELADSADAIHTKKPTKTSESNDSVGTKKLLSKMKLLLTTVDMLTAKLESLNIKADDITSDLTELAFSEQSPEASIPHRRGINRRTPMEQPKNLCYYHRTFGSASKKCQLPCYYYIFMSERRTRRKQKKKPMHNKKHPIGVYYHKKITNANTNETIQAIETGLMDIDSI